MVIKFTRSQTSASIARERLLRAAETPHALASLADGFRLPAPPLSATFAAPLDGSERRNLPPILSRAEQEIQIVQVARTFKNYYLAEFTYQPDSQLMSAVIKPMAVRANPADLPLRIHVDLYGNISILLDDSPIPSLHQVGKWPWISRSALILLVIILIVLVL